MLLFFFHFYGTVERSQNHCHTCVPDITSCLGCKMNFGNCGCYASGGGEEESLMSLPHVHNMRTWNTRRKNLPSQSNLFKKICLALYIMLSTSANFTVCHYLLVFLTYWYKNHSYSGPRGWYISGFQPLQIWGIWRQCDSHPQPPQSQISQWLSSHGTVWYLSASKASIL